MIYHYVNDMKCNITKYKTKFLQTIVQTIYFLYSATSCYVIVLRL